MVKSFLSGVSKPIKLFQFPPLWKLWPDRKYPLYDLPAFSKIRHKSKIQNPKPKITSDLSRTTYTVHLISYTKTTLSIWPKKRRFTPNPDNYNSRISRSDGLRLTGSHINRSPNLDTSQRPLNMAYPTVCSGTVVCWSPATVSVNNIVNAKM